MFIESTTEYLPQFTLDRLTERVCLKLPHFDGNFKLSEIWSQPIDYCQKIMQEPRNVCSVILSVRSSLSGLVAQNVRWYQLMLTRVYILLYYHHHDDAVYKSMVFPSLMENMGIYAEQMKQWVHAEIGHMIEQDKMVEEDGRDRLRGSVIMLGALRQRLQCELDNKRYDPLAERIDRLSADPKPRLSADPNEPADACGKGFTCGEYACLLYAAANLTDEGATKSALVRLFSKITGYSEANFNRKLMGAFSEADKTRVAALLDDVLPLWAEKIRKL